MSTAWFVPLPAWRQTEFILKEKCDFSDSSDSLLGFDQRPLSTYAVRRVETERSPMHQHVIDYHIADIGHAWGIFREGVQIAVRKDPGDAIAFANFFADRETRMAAHPVRVSADRHMHRTLIELRRAA
jgi:hypothetical protein